MGKAGRFLCIFTPYVLTIASLICIIMVGLGCTDKTNSAFNNLYFFRANLQDFTTSTKTTSEISAVLESHGVDASSQQLTQALEQAKSAASLEDFYSIGLWGYCDGTIKNKNYNTTFCSKPEAEFYFNPVEVWGLKDSGAENVLPDSFHKAMTVYKDVSKWMFIAYIIAFVATVVELVVGIFAICSRWGSCVTTLVSCVSLLFTIAASATSTALFATLKGTFNEQLKSYGITGSMGENMFAATWLAVAFSLGATIFWTFSSCCCSGRSSQGHDRVRHRDSNSSEKGLYNYEPVSPSVAHNPYNTSYPNTSYPPTPMPPTHGESVPMHNMHTNAYEPFRHV